MSRFKRWWNRTQPDQLCEHRWCWRYMAYQYRCYLHQEDE